MTNHRRAMTICFHGIGRPGRDLESGEERFWITPERFIEILDTLAHHPRQVDVTFDDGNASDHEFGMPELQQRGIKAEFFVIGGRLGQPGSLTPDQLREMRASGMAIGNHGLRHLPWHEVASDADLHEEIEGSAALIESHIGTRPKHAACPRGSYDRRVLSLLRKSGYERVYSVDEGTSRRSSWLRSRYSVTQFDTARSVSDLLDRPDGGVTTRLRRTAAQTIKRIR